MRRCSLPLPLLMCSFSTQGKSRGKHCHHEFGMTRHVLCSVRVSRNWDLYFPNWPLGNYGWGQASQGFSQCFPPFLLLSETATAHTAISHISASLTHCPKSSSFNSIRWSKTGGIFSYLSPIENQVPLRMYAVRWGKSFSKIKEKHVFLNRGKTNWYLLTNMDKVNVKLRMRFIPNMQIDRKLMKFSAGIYMLKIP